MAREARSVEGASGPRSAGLTPNAGTAGGRDRQLRRGGPAHRRADLAHSGVGGRDTFVGQRESAVRRYLKLLLEGGRLQEALRAGPPGPLAAAPPARGEGPAGSPDQPEQQRVGRVDVEVLEPCTPDGSGAAREDQLPGDERKRAMAAGRGSTEARRDLDGAMAQPAIARKREESHPSPPGPGEVILAYHPLPKGWVGFAATRRASSLRLFDLPEDALADPGAPGRAVLAARLIAPFQRSSTGRTMCGCSPSAPCGPSTSTPCRSPVSPSWRGSPWSTASTCRPLPSPAPAGPPVALLVADPEGNLPAAREESGALPRRSAVGARVGLRNRWRARSQSARCAARFRRQSLRVCRARELRGSAGWDSALRLAAGSRLTPGDLLTLRRRRPGSCSPPAKEAARVRAGAGRGDRPRPGLPAGRQPRRGRRHRSVQDRRRGDFVREMHRNWQPGVDLARQCSEPSGLSRGWIRPAIARASASSSADPTPCQKLLPARKPELAAEWVELDLARA